MNQQLVKGEAFVRQTAQPTYLKEFKGRLNAGIGQVAQINAAKKAERNQINNKVSTYINQLNSDIDLTNLNESQQQAVTNYLVEERNKYAEAATQITKIEDPSSQEYLNYRDQMNGIQRSFGNLANQLNKYKEDKVSYLKDFDDRRVSDGNEIGSLKKASRIYTDEGSMGIGPGGQVTFWDDDDGKYENYSTIQKPFLKDFKAADNILALNESVYSSGKALTGARKDMIRNKLKNMINSGGRDTVLSLASDDFLISGGLNLQDPSIFEPENQDMLADTVLDSYMTALTDTAAQGANDKRPASRRGTGGYSGALKDEVNVSGPVANNAMEFSKFGTPVAANQRENKAREMVNIINSVDPTSKQVYASRGEFYDMWTNGYDLDDNKETRAKFSQQYGPSQIFSLNPKDIPGSKPLAINTDDPYQLYEFYLKNTGLSTKARNHYLTNFDGQKKESNPKQTKTNNNPSTGGGSLDNI
tara:strand:+ start:39 stop:1457 length:1419 start_codon:yes stop_codon:yes gene_type:complete